MSKTKKTILIFVSIFTLLLCGIGLFLGLKTKSPKLGNAAQAFSLRIQAAKGNVSPISYEWGEEWDEDGELTSFGSPPNWFSLPGLKGSIRYSSTSPFTYFYSTLGNFDVMSSGECYFYDTAAERDAAFSQGRTDASHKTVSVNNNYLYISFDDGYGPSSCFYSYRCERFYYRTLFTPANGGYGSKLYDFRSINFSNPEEFCCDMRDGRGELIMLFDNLGEKKTKLHYILGVDGGEEKIIERWHNVSSSYDISDISSLASSFSYHGWSFQGWSLYKHSANLYADKNVTSLSTLAPNVYAVYKRTLKVNFYEYNSSGLPVLMTTKNAEQNLFSDFTSINGNLSFPKNSGDYEWQTADGTVYSEDMIGWNQEPTLNLYYRPLVHEIKLINNGATSTYSINIKNSSLTFPNVDKTGYTFQYWSGATNNFNAGTYMKDAFTNKSLNVKTALTFTAYYTANKYLVTLNRAGALNGSTSVTATYDSSLPNITPPKKTGYTFEGYYHDTTKYYNADGSSARTWNIASDTILTAKWTENKYRINFDGDETTFLTEEILYTQKYTLEFFPEKAGYLFLYWENGANKYYDGQTVSKLTPTNNETLTFTAVWEETWAAHAEEPKVKDNIYQISSAENLAWLATQRNLDKDCLQTADIDLAKYTWKPIENFNGVSYLGQGYVIKNLQTISIKNHEGQYLYSDVGLFGSTTNANFYAITIASGNIHGNINVGAIVGNATAGSVQNCTNKAEVNGNTNVGMIGSGRNLMIKACYNYGDIAGMENVGGMVGTLTGKSSITKSYVNATITNGNGLLGNGDVDINLSGYEGNATNLGGNATDCFNCEEKTITDSDNWVIINGKLYPKGLVF